MLLEPGRKGVRRGVFQYIDRGMTLQVNQHSAVALSLAPRPFIDSQHFDSSRGRQSSVTHQAQDRISTTRHPLPLAQLSSRFATDDLSERTQVLLQARCALSVRQKEVRQGFGEGLAWTHRIRAA